CRPCEEGIRPADEKAHCREALDDAVQRSNRLLDGAPQMKISLALLTLFALAAFAQQPNIKNARLESRSAASGLEPAFQQSVANRNTPAWIGYSVPIVKGDHSMCCYNGLHGCSLESKTG